MSASHLAPRLEDYGQKFKHIKLSRREGILEVRFHSDGDSMKWCGTAHDEAVFCFRDIADDPENQVVILTGEGEAFCAEPDVSSFGEINARVFLDLHLHGLRLLENLLSIPVPVIGAVNGPALIHADLLVLSNIVIACEEASFADSVHFNYGIVPGDGVHVVWPALLGPTRASYFLLTGQVLDARRALDLGVVNEVVPRARLLPRAWELAEQILKAPLATRRYSRHLLTQPMKRMMKDDLSHGLAVEGLAMLDKG